MVRWLWGASEEAGASRLLGLHQLLQALQHGQTQGLEPGGRHSQGDSLMQEDTGRGEKSKGAHRCLGQQTHGWFSSRRLSSTGETEEPGPPCARPPAQSQTGLQTLFGTRAECTVAFQRFSSTGRGLAEWAGRQSRDQEACAQAQARQ